VQAGSKARVSGTPAFFINGIAVAGAQPASAFEKIIDAELKRIEQQNASNVWRASLWISI
jgi:predicted DsbA family dithiol-disulfide isomerase